MIESTISYDDTILMLNVRRYDQRPIRLDHAVEIPYGIEPYRILGFARAAGMTQGVLEDGIYCISGEADAVRGHFLATIDGILLAHKKITERQRWIDPEYPSYEHIIESHSIPITPLTQASSFPLITLASLAHMNVPVGIVVPIMAASYLAQAGVRSLISRPYGIMLADMNARFRGEPILEEKLTMHMQAYAHRESAENPLVESENQNSHDEEQGLHVRNTYKIREYA